MFDVPDSTTNDAKKRKPKKAQDELCVLFSLFSLVGSCRPTVVQSPVG